MVSSPDCGVFSACRDRCGMNGAAGMSGCSFWLSACCLNNNGSPRNGVRAFDFRIGLQHRVLVDVARGVSREAILKGIQSAAAVGSAAWPLAVILISEVADFGEIDRRRRITIWPRRQRKGNIIPWTGIYITFQYAFQLDEAKSSAPSRPN